MSAERSPSMRVTIRPHVYRGVWGYSVRSRAGGIYGTRVFVLTLPEAEHVKRNLKSGRDATAGLWGDARDYMPEVSD